MGLTFGRFTLKYRWLLIALMMALLAVSGAGILKLKTIVDPRAYFAADDPRMLELNKLDRVYSKSEVVVIALFSGEEKVFSPKILAGIEWLTEKSWELPFVLRADSITNYQHTRVVGDDLFVNNLVSNPLKLTNDEIAEIKRIATTEPSLVDYIVSKDGEVTAIIIKFLKPGKSLSEDAQIATAVRKIVDEFKENYKGIDVHLAGDIIFNDVFATEANKDMATLIPAMFGVMVVVIALTLRSFWGTVITLLIIVASSVTGMGISGWIGIPMGDIASMAPTIILTLAVADSVHILSTIFKQMRLGKSKEEAIGESMRVNLQPVFLTSITTAIGFLSMNMGDSPVFHDLGNMVALGVTAAFIYSIILVPTLFYILPIKVKAKDETENLLAIRLADFVIDKRRSLFIGVGSCMLLLSVGIPQITFDDKFIEYISAKSELRQSYNKMVKHLAIGDVIEFSIPSGEEGGVTNPDYLKKLDEFEKWLKQQPKIRHVASINDTMKRLNKTMHFDDDAWYRIPESRELSAQYLLLYEMSLPFGLDLTTQVNLDKSASRFQAFIINASSMEIVAMEEKANLWIKNNFPKEMQADGGGLSVMFAHLTEQNVKSMLFGTSVALFLISAILIIALKSLKIGLISLVPNLTPALMSFGLWGLMIGEVGLGVAIVAAMTLGIVVDDTVHFLSKYTRARREHNMNAEEAVRYSFGHVGVAIIITSLVLVSGFMVLTFSEFKVNADMGFLTAITIVFALGADLLFLPPLLIKLEGK